MKRNYLPSRQFAIKLIALVVAILVIFGIYKTVHYFKNRKKENAPDRIAVRDIVQKDSNENGIPDWEESLWGLDPAKNGEANREFILSERAALAKQSGAPVVNNGNPTSENEKLAREFFAIIMSLEQTGNLDETSLTSVSDAIGEKIVAAPIADIYLRNILTIENSTKTASDAYYKAFNGLLTKYKNKNIGDELSFVATALKNNDKGALEEVRGIASSYKAFGKDLMEISVPASLVSIHLRLANNYEKTGQSIEGFANLLSEPLIGMKAIINYKRYSDALVADIERLSDNL